MKIIMIMAVTVDGKIAKNDSQLVDWTPKEDKIFFQKHSMDAGVVIMGSKTFATFQRPLPKRLNAVMCLEKEFEEVPGLVKLFINKTAREVKKELSETGFKKAVLGGGAFINGMFLKEKMVDEIYLVIAPKIFGRGLSLINEQFDLDYDLKLIDAQKLGSDLVVVKYKVIYKVSS